MSGAVEIATPTQSPRLNLFPYIQSIIIIEIKVTGARLWASEVVTVTEHGRVDTVGKMFSGIKRIFCL